MTKFEEEDLFYRVLIIVSSILVVIIDDNMLQVNSTIDYVEMKDICL